MKTANSPHPGRGNPSLAASAGGGHLARRLAGLIPAALRTRIRARSWDRTAGLLFLLPAIVYMLALYGYPVVKNFLMALQNYTTTTFYTGAAPWVGLANYRTVVSSPLFRSTLEHTAVFTIGSIAGQFTIGLALAVFFQRRFPLNGVLRSLLLLPWLIPLIATSAVWRWILDMDNGALNRFLAAAHLAHHPGWLTNPSLALFAVTVVNIWVEFRHGATSRPSKSA